MVLSSLNGSLLQQVPVAQLVPPEPLAPQVDFLKPLQS